MGHSLPKTKGRAVSSPAWPRQTPLVEGLLQGRGPGGWGWLSLYSVSIVTAWSTAQRQCPQDTLPAAQEVRLAVCCEETLTRRRPGTHFSRPRPNSQMGDALHGRLGSPLLLTVCGGSEGALSCQSPATSPFPAPSGQAAGSQTSGVIAGGRQSCLRISLELKCFLLRF